MEKCRVSLFLFVLAALGSCTPGDRYYDKDDFGRVKKADTHNHIFSESGAMADQAAADNFFLINVNLEEPALLSLPGQGRVGRYQQNAHPGRVAWLTAFSTEGIETPGWAGRTIARLQKDFDDGALGIKIWKNIGMSLRDSAGRFILIDDPRFDPVIDFVVKSGKTVMGHLGEPKDCWLPLDSMTVLNDRDYYSKHPQYHLFLHPEYPDYARQIAARDHLLQKHPGMVFVGAHLASLEWSTDELAAHFDRYPNLAADLAERLSHLQYQSQKDYDKVRNFVLKYQDRLLYGSDLILDSAATDTAALKQHAHQVWKQEWDYLVSADSLESDRVRGKFKGLHLPKDVVDKIFFGNAVKWFKWPAHE